MNIIKIEAENIEITQPLITIQSLKIRLKSLLIIQIKY